jgi:UrcA family protein
VEGAGRINKNAMFRKDEVMHASKLVFMRPALIAVLGLAAFAGATGASAQAGATENQTIEVRYDDLDLSAPAGVERLQTRVRFAAKRICEYPGIVGIEAHRVRRDCLDETMANADRDIKLAIAEHGAERHASRGTIGVGTR